MDPVAASTAPAPVEPVPRSLPPSPRPAASVLGGLHEAAAAKDVMLDGPSLLSAVMGYVLGRMPPEAARGFGAEFAGLRVELEGLARSLED